MTMRRERTAFIIPCECIATGLGVAGASAGTTNTAVLRWLPTGTGPTPTTNDITVTDSTTLGMTFTLNEPGAYHIEMWLHGVAATTISAGLSINAAVAPLVANPAVGTDGVFAAQLYTAAAAAVYGPYFHTLLRIADNQVGAVLRTHATDGAGGVANPSLVEATCYLRITRPHDMG